MNSVHTLLFIVCALHYPVFHLSVKYAEHESLQNAIASHTKSLLAARYMTQYVTQTEFGHSKDRYHKIIQDDDYDDDDDDVVDDDDDDDDDGHDDHDDEGPTGMMVMMMKRGMFEKG